MIISLVKPQYITNEDGEKISVILPVSEYERIIGELEDIDDVRLYDEAKSRKEDSMPFEDYLRQRQSR